MMLVSFSVLLKAMTPEEVTPLAQVIVAEKPLRLVLAPSVPSENVATTPVNDWPATGLMSTPVACGALIM